jgi:peptide/nickel transport system substrate-binding protein
LEELDDIPELKDKKVRQALNYAIDKQTMLSSLRNNIGFPAISGVIPKGLPSYNPDKVEGYSYDLKKARDLLAEAGYPNGENFSEIVIHTNKDYLDITTFVAKQWERLGIDTKIQLLESASLREGMRKGTIDVFRASWIADYPDGENFLSMFYSGNPAPPRYTRFINSKFDNLYEASISETDLIEKYKLYDLMNAILIEEAPVIFLFYDESSWFVSKSIEGIETNALNLLNVKQLNEK